MMAMGKKMKDFVEDLYESRPKAKPVMADTTKVSRVGGVKRTKGKRKGKLKA